MSPNNESKLLKIWSRRAYVLLMAYPIGLTIALLAVILILWPSSNKPGGLITLSDDVRFLLIVALAGGLGSTVRLLRVIPQDYRKFIKEYMGSHDKSGPQKSQGVAKASYESEFPFYILRPFLGPPVAVILYLAIRGGLLSANTAEVNHFGMIALAGLAGLFSDSAIDKLKKVFNTLLGMDEESQPKPQAVQTESRAADEKEPHTGTVK